MAFKSGGEKKRSAFFRGASGMKQTDVELEHAKQRAEQRKTMVKMPFRFRADVGETKRIIICDDKPDFFMYEHAMKDQDGKWGRLFTGCVKTFDNCPVCKAQDKESYYAMMLTCIDLTPFKLRDGTEIEFSRKLLVVKPAQQKKFHRFYSKEGTLRGAMFEMTRDGDKDSSIGNDIEFVEFVDEKELATYTRSWKDRDGKKHTENCDEPFVYEELFEEPTTEALLALAGGEPAAGSRAQAARELGERTPRRGRAAADEEEDETPRARRASSRAKKDDDWEDENEEAPFDADEAPRRGSRKAAEEAPTRSRATRRVEEPDEEEEAEEAPPRRAAKAAAKPARGRAPEPDVEEEEEEDDAPPARRAPARAPSKEERPVRSRRAEPEEEEEEEVPEVPATRSRRAREEPAAEPRRIGRRVSR